MRMSRSTFAAVGVSGEWPDGPLRLSRPLERVKVRWKKLGLVFRPDPTIVGMHSHAMLPTPIVIDDRIRVYFSSRDGKGRGRPFFVELDAHDPTRQIRGPMGPLLDLGAPGTFDQDGVIASSIVYEADRLLLYYVGFELGTQIRYRLLTGLAISRDHGETFQRLHHTPVLERSDEERLFRCAPFVVANRDGYRMWYIGGSGWTQVDGKDVPVYDLRIAESPDGTKWPTSGRVCLSPEEPEEHGLGRPWILQDADRQHLFFSTRHRVMPSYRLACAESTDGVSWRRLDSMGLDVSPLGWDSQAIMYSAVVDAHGRRFCFYNGNDFGRDGFGVAVLESD